jgi:hypothetical protein
MVFFTPSDMAPSWCTNQRSKSLDSYMQCILSESNMNISLTSTIILHLLQVLQRPLTYVCLKGINIIKRVIIMKCLLIKNSVLAGQTALDAMAGAGWRS